MNFLMPPTPGEFVGVLSGAQYAVCNADARISWLSKRPESVLDSKSFAAGWSPLSVIWYNSWFSGKVKKLRSHEFTTSPESDIVKTQVTPPAHLFWAFCYLPVSGQGISLCARVTFYPKSL